MASMSESTHEHALTIWPVKLVVQLKLADNDKQKEWSSLISLISRRVLPLSAGVRVQ
jgi:hypothetical protein